jgi:DNA repair protein RadC
LTDKERYHVAEAALATYRPPDRPAVTTAEQTYELCRAMCRYRVEVFRVLLLDARHHLIRKVTVSRGSLNASIVHPREVFRPAIVASAAAVVLVHNHPSGDPTPSRDDLELTKRLVKVGELLGIEVLDHVIVVRSGFLSFKQERLP